MDKSDARATFKGWTRPGPVPVGGIDVAEDESLDYLSGHWRIFQYKTGHRFSTDDVVLAWYASQWAPRVDRYCDLGCGIGSVALSVAWRLPGCSVVTVEAQEISLSLQKKSIRYNGVESRFTSLLGDLRDAHVLDGQGTFDLVTGSPPYWPIGGAVAANHPQAVPARLEVRGTIADYAATAARVLAPGGVFCTVFQASQDARARAAIDDAGLALVRARAVRFKEGVEASVSGLMLYCAHRREDLPDGWRRPTFEEPPLTIRTTTGAVTPEYAAVKLSFGFPPG
jgi:tRNA1Val (adenine37-N6)-methyltransferase